MTFVRLLLAVLLVVQAFGLSELLHAHPDTDAASHADCASHQDEGQGQEAQRDAACEWHCSVCNVQSLPREQSGLVQQLAAVGRQRLMITHSFVPAAPCASIFHPPA